MPRGIHSILLQYDTAPADLPPEAASGGHKRDTEQHLNGATVRDVYDALKVELKIPQLARGIAQAAELVKKFNGLAHVRIPGVAKWRYTLENDWSGDPAIFFWVTLTDEASEPARLRKTKNAFIATINNHVDLSGDWGLFPYYNFRSQSEQAKLKDEVYE